MESFLQLENFVTVLLWLCGSVVAVAGAVAVIVKFWKWAHKTSDENAVTLSEIETYLASDKRRIEQLERYQAVNDTQNKMILKALVALLGHEIDGNHVDKLSDIRDSIQDYLIER